MQRGHVTHANLQVLNAFLDIAEHGCPWRGLPERCGNWHTISTRLNRWAQNGVLARVCAQMRRERLGQINLEALALDSTIVKVHPAGTGALQKNGPQALGRSRGGWTTQLPPGAADARTALAFALSPGPAHDAPEGRQCRTARASGTAAPRCPGTAPPRAPRPGRWPRRGGPSPGCRRGAPWEYDRELGKRRNASERLFRRWQGFRRSFSRFEKLDVVLLGFIVFALIVDALR